MCLPLAAIGAIAGVAGAGAGFIGQRQQAKAQAAYQAQSAAAEQQRALQEQSSIRMQQAQQQEATARELQQVSKKSQEALSRARVSAGEAGVSGVSVQALMDDYTRQEAGYRAATLRQQELTGVGTQLGLEQAGLASQQRLIGIQQPINRPSLLVSGLQAVSGGLSGYAAGQSISSRMGSPSTIDIGGGQVSRYMPKTDQYSIPTPGY
jgi:hypothetical protein